MRALYGIILISLIVFSCGKKNTLNEELSQFKVLDTASVDKIFMADKSNRKVLLTKENGKWKVDQQFEARPDIISDLMNVLARVEVKQFVPKTAVSNTLKSLAVNSTKVEIYQKGKLTKVFYVGGPTQDHYGTYMLLEGSTVPFICYIPGFRGYLTPYFIPFAEEWRDKTIFSYHINQIKSVQVDFVRAPEQSYRIEHNNGQFAIRLLKDNQLLPSVDTLQVKDYMKLFKVVGFESFLNVNKARLDSVTTKYGLYKVTVTQTDGSSTFVDLYQIPLPPGTINVFGDEERIDVDRMYGLINGKMLVLCQYFTFDPITVPVTFFQPLSRPVRKEKK